MTQETPLEENKDEGMLEPDMVIVEPNPQHRYSMHMILHGNLIWLKKEVLKKDYDGFIVCDGMERKGKSTLLMQVATFLDPTFNLDRVCFTINQFIRAVESATKGQAIVFDETMGYLGSRSSMSKFNRSLIKIFSEMGSKNLFVLLAIPSFFELDKYAAIHRSVCLLHVYQRGRFTGFNYGKKKLLYINGKKFYSYGNPAADFIGCFPKYFPLDKAAYEKKKQEGINEFTMEKESVKEAILNRNRLIDHLSKNHAYTSAELGRISGLSIREINTILDIKANWRRHFKD